MPLEDKWIYLWVFHFLLQNSVVFFYNFLWCSSIDAIGRKWESPPLLPLTHHVHETDGNVITASKRHHVFDGLGRGWYMDSSGHFLATPEWPKNIRTLGTKCPWAAIKSCAPATRGWNWHPRARLHASCRIRGPVATLWPLLLHRTPAAKHCGTYKKLKQDTFFQAWLRCSNASRTCRASKPTRQESVRSKSLPDARQHDTAISALMAWCYIE